MLRRLNDIAKFPDEDNNCINYTLDAIINNVKLRTLTHSKYNTKFVAKKLKIAACTKCRITGAPAIEGGIKFNTFHLPGFNVSLRPGRGGYCYHVGDT